MPDKPWWLPGPILPVIGFSITNNKRTDFEFSGCQSKLGFSDLSGNAHFASVGVWPRILTVDEIVHLTKHFDHNCQCALCVEGGRK